MTCTRACIVITRKCFWWSAVLWEKHMSGILNECFPRTFHERADARSIWTISEWVFIFLGEETLLWLFRDTDGNNLTSLSKEDNASILILSFISNVLLTFDSMTRTRSIEFNVVIVWRWAKEERKTIEVNDAAYVWIASTEEKATWWI